MPTHRIVAAACPLDSRQKSTNQFLTPALGPVSETRAAELASRHLRRTMASAPLEAEEADFETSKGVKVRQFMPADGVWSVCACARTSLAVHKSVCRCAREARLLQRRWHAR